MAIYGNNNRTAARGSRPSSSPPSSPSSPSSSSSSPSSRSEPPPMPTPDAATNLSLIPCHQLKPHLEFDVVDSIVANGEAKNELPSGSSASTSKATVSVSSPCLNKALSKAHLSILLESLIWKITEYNEQDPQKQWTLYQMLCKNFSNVFEIGDTFQWDALQPARIHFSQSLQRFILEVKSNLTNPLSLGLPVALQPAAPSELLYTRHHRLMSSRYLSHFEPSHYKKQFLQLDLIEEGGFGIVFKAKHKIDAVVYAVKMIPFRIKRPELFKKITREVELYANLESHPNVVGYKTTWLEYGFLKDGVSRLPGNRSSSDGQETDDDVNVSFLSSLKESRTKSKVVESVVKQEVDEEEEEDDDLSIRFMEMSTNEIKFHSSVKILEIHEVKDQVTCSIDEEDEDEHEEKVEVEDEERTGITIMQRKRVDSELSAKSFSDSVIDYGHLNHKHGSCRKKTNEGWFECQQKTDCYEAQDTELKYGAVLYIQMELCDKNLKTWIKERNEEIQLKISSSDGAKDVLDLIDVTQSLGIFRQIVKGVEFLHSNHLIHRDLKPQNILFSLNTEKVKIGDFGLATLHEEEANLCHSWKPIPSRSVHEEMGDHTVGLGTTVYASPEQRDSSVYDNKADMFSLGVVLLELCYPFLTNMEKGKCVERLKKQRKLPEQLEQKWPQIAEIIVALTDPIAKKRPNASDVLQSQLFCTKDQRILRLEEEKADLEARLQEKDKLIASLQASLWERDQRINLLQGNKKGLH